MIGPLLVAAVTAFTSPTLMPSPTSAAVQMPALSMMARAPPKAALKKAAQPKAALKKAAPKKAVAKKPVAKKAVAKKPVAKKPVAKAAAPKKAGYSGFWETEEFQQKQAAAAKAAGRGLPARRAARPATQTFVRGTDARGVVSPARAFEQSFAPIFVPSREAERRPDLKRANAVDPNLSAAKTFEKRFAPLFVPSREAKRRPDLKALNEKK